MNQWLRGSLFDNIDQFANSLGYQNVGIVMSLAMVPWESPEDRDEFIYSITGREPQGGTGKNFTSGTFGGA